MSESLTACIIAKDEERRLPACLESLVCCDEIVVVDGGSRDRTREVARAAGARVVESPWPGFAAQRNIALDHAHGDWVLEIDADERVTPKLANEIKALLRNPPPNVRMTAIPRRAVFLGHPLGPAARYPGYVHRLFRGNEAFRHDETRAVHEGLWPDGPTLPLEGEITHLLASSWREALHDARAYAKLEALQRSRLDPLEVLLGGLIRPAVKFIYRLLIYGAWRDGWRGLAKLGLECGGDALAAAYRLRSTATDRAGAGFAQRPPRTGPVRMVGVGLSASRTMRLARWLEEAGAEGADISLICTHAPNEARVRCRMLRTATPGAMVRALDAEEQIRPIDALVTAGWCERPLLGLSPMPVRGGASLLNTALPASEAVQLLQAQTRSQARS